jgi:hypothetical protein
LADWTSGPYGLKVGRIVDAWRDTRALSSVILVILGVTLALFPLVGVTTAGPMALLFSWGAVGWGSLAPLSPYRSMLPRSVSAARPVRSAVARCSVVA